MARLIDADAMWKSAIEERRFVFKYEDMLKRTMVFETVYSDLAQFINEQPTVDAVEVVRCKDCEHFVNAEDVSFEYANPLGADGFCTNICKYTDTEHFCGYGEKMDGDKE